MSALGVRRDKGGAFQWVQVPPGKRSSRKQPEQSSDFYAAYDSIECPQQKCLIHLMRDLNDEILKNPFDQEAKLIALRFAALLKP
ncbi:MAG: hypothetical protein WBF73_12620, partial [Bradyrhizobium sp.]